jgi:ABC-type multidrug transport system fused ATPase/permease subunit
MGTHENLMDKGGLYAELVKTQVAAEEAVEKD